MCLDSASSTNGKVLQSGEAAVSLKGWTTSSPQEVDRLENEYFFQEKALCDFFLKISVSE